MDLASLLNRRDRTPKKRPAASKARGQKKVEPLRVESESDPERPQLLFGLSSLLKHGVWPRPPYPMPGRLEDLGPKPQENYIYVSI